MLLALAFYGAVWVLVAGLVYLLGTRIMTTGSVTASVRTLLRLEGLTTLLFAVAFYAAGGYSWGLFAALFLVPDISLAGYLAGPRAGAVVYNMAHSSIGPLVLAAVLFSNGRSVELPLIWLAHVGFDRASGFGLKYPTSFGDTHLGRIGRSVQTA